MPTSVATDAHPAWIGNASLGVKGDVVPLMPSERSAASLFESRVGMRSAWTEQEKTLVMRYSTAQY